MELTSTTNKTADENKKREVVEDNYDLKKQLSMVLGALESTIEDRKQTNTETGLSANQNVIETADLSRSVS